MTPVKIIAEIGSVHDGSFGNAQKLIALAAEVGADVVKFQTHIAAAETIPNAPMPPYFKGEPRFEYFTRTGFSKIQWIELKAQCEAQGVEFMSSPFSEEAVDLLEEIGVQSYKIASGEVTNIPMLEKIAQTGKPVFLSSGMSNWAELDRAVEALDLVGDKLMVMQCSSMYPCPPQNAGLNVMAEMKARYKKPVGFSDHTEGMAACIAAAALGAQAVEKHLTFSRKMYGSDAAFATEPEDFKTMVRAIRDVQAMLAHPVDKDDQSAYAEMKSIFQKSLVVLKPVKKGEMLTVANIGIKKPGTGIAPEDIARVMGKKSANDLEMHHILTWDDVGSE